MPNILSFEEAIEESADQNRRLLLGNGFSIAQAGGQFSYSNLLDQCGLSAESPIRNVFGVLDTADFEEVMRALEHAAQIEVAYDDNERSQQFRNDASEVREALIQAIREVHPGIQFDIPEAQRKACARFLNNFATIFTLNYDLLLYWVILKAARNNHSDGFGLGHEINGFRTFQTDANCSTYYLHGALHLFLDQTLETQKRIVTNTTIIDDIASTIRHTKQLPLFVAEGTTTQKIAKINSVPYLRHSYEFLMETSGSLFIFGHSVSSNDSHIYDAVFASGIEKLFFCVHQVDEDWSDLREKLAPYSERRNDIDIAYVEAASANVWGAD